jgi:hypothetical protein
MAEYDDYDLEIEDTQEAGGSEPPPPGTYLVRLECDPMVKIGQTLGFKIRGRIVEGNYRGRLIEDVLFWTDASKPRLVLVLSRIGGLEKGEDGRWPSLKAGGARELLNGKLARMTVDKVVYNKRDDKTEYTEAQAIQLRAKGDQVYAHTRVPFAGYEAPTAEEVKSAGGDDPDALLFGSSTSNDAPTVPNGKAKLPY